MAWTTPKTWTVGEVVTAANMNLHLRDNLNAIGEHVGKAKAVTESVTSNTTLQNDDDLFFAAGANQVWLVHMQAQVQTGAGGYKQHFVVPSGGSFSYGYLFNDGSVFVYSSSTDASTQSWSSTGISAPMEVWGVFRTGATPGDLQYQWAQFASNAAASTVQAASSFIKATRIA